MMKTAALYSKLRSKSHFYLMSQSQNHEERKAMIQLSELNLGDFLNEDTHEITHLDHRSGNLMPKTIAQMI